MTSTSSASPAIGSADDAAATDASPQHEQSTPVVELNDLGICYRLHRRHFSLKDAILTGRWRKPAPLFWALRNVNLTCHEGQVLGIVGRNGAGKSTICLALSGILAPDEGTAQINGRVSALLSLGAGFNQELTGRANILLNAMFLGIPRNIIKARIGEIIAFAELGDFIDEPVRTYSSGMKARLAFSVAAILEPEILILDELLSVGDKAFKTKSRKRMHELMEKSRLIVVVSHSMSFLRDLCTHCLWLDKGTVQMHGPAGDVLDAYDQATK